MLIAATTQRSLTYSINFLIRSFENGEHFCSPFYFSGLDGLMLESVILLSTLKNGMLQLIIFLARKRIFCELPIKH
jgi:hypothetical protein